MQRRTTCALAAAVAVLASASALAGGGWEKDGTKNGVTVWTREVEGSKIDEIKATAILGSPTVEAYELLVESEQFLSVMPDVVVSKKIGECGECCGYWYQRIEHPPVKDRYYVIKVKWRFTENEDGTTTIKRWWRTTNAVSAPDTSGIEVERMRGSWHFKPTGGGAKTRFTYRNHLEMGGSIPAFMVNSAAVSNAYKFIARLRKKL
jgi:hypothetical protein